MAQPSIRRAWRRFLAAYGINSVSSISWLMWSKRCWGLAAKQPKLPKGRPSTPAAQQAARTKKRLAEQRAALFASRYLFVQRHLNKTERKTLWRVSRGLPQLHALRAVMDQVYALDII